MPEIPVRERAFYFTKGSTDIRFARVMGGNGKKCPASFAEFAVGEKKTAVLRRSFDNFKNVMFFHRSL
jgi:hypothetical protein